jgi:hypothetical protein
MIKHLVERSKKFDEGKSDYGPAPVKGNFMMSSFGDLDTGPTLVDGGGTKPMTEHAFRQMCGRLGTVAWPGRSRSLPATYLLTCPAYLRADNINHWIGETPSDTEWFIREYDGTIRAVLTNRYSVVDITETLEWIDEALKSGGQDSVELVQTTVSPDVMHVKVLFQNIEVKGNGDAPYAIGGYFTNGEIGNRRMGAYPLVQRHACTNSIIIPDDRFSWDHIHTGSRMLMKRLFIDSIFGVLEGAVEALDRLLMAQEPMPSFKQHLDDLVSDKGWSLEQRDSILLGTEGYESLFGLVQGVSAMANTIDDPDERADIQLAAGKVLLGGRIG